LHWRYLLQGLQLPVLVRNAVAHVTTSNRVSDHVMDVMAGSPSG